MAVPWLNWIEQPPPKGQVTGSNPVGITSYKFSHYISTFCGSVSIVGGGGF